VPGFAICPEGILLASYGANGDSNFRQRMSGIRLATKDHAQLSSLFLNCFKAHGTNAQHHLYICCVKLRIRREENETLEIRNGTDCQRLSVVRDILGLVLFQMLNIFSKSSLVL